MKLDFHLDLDSCRYNLQLDKRTSQGLAKEVENKFLLYIYILLFFQTYFLSTFREMDPFPQARSVLLLFPIRFRIESYYPSQPSSQVVYLLYTIMTQYRKETLITSQTLRSAFFDDWCCRDDPSSRGLMSKIELPMMLLLFFGMITLSSHMLTFFSFLLFKPDRC